MSFLKKAYAFFFFYSKQKEPHCSSVKILICDIPFLAEFDGEIIYIIIFRK